MHCPKCQTADTRVIDSRHLDLGSAVRRRRRCDPCQHRFTTYEQIESELPTIVKNDGRREVFGRDKIMKGLLKACQKRPISVTELNLIVDKIETSLSLLGQKEVASTYVGQLLMEELKRIDPVAFVRFASFYWNFDDIDSFVSGLKNNFVDDMNQNNLNEQPDGSITQ